MNAYHLYKPDGTETQLMACEACGTVYGDRLGETSEWIAMMADRCCTPKTCKRCGEPDGSNRRFDAYTLPDLCSACRKADDDERHVQRIERAEKLAEWDDWVWVHEVSHNEGFFESVEALVEWLADNWEDYGPEERAEWPAYAFVCKGSVFLLDLEDELYSACEDHHDGAADRLVGVKELQAAVDRFNEANAHVVTYHPDFRRVVAVPPMSVVVSGGEGVDPTP